MPHQLAGSQPHAAASSSSSSPIGPSPSTRSFASSACGSSRPPLLVSSSPPPLPVSVSKVERCPHELVLTQLPAEAVTQATGGLLNLLFFSPNSDRRFFSYTHTSDELSLLLDVPTAVAAFPPGVLTIGPGTWCILEILEGAEIIDTPGIVSSLTAPLLSTRQVDELLYLSTFVSDLLLVRVAQVDVAEQVVGASLDFLIESRRKAALALAAAEEQERDEERTRREMEQEDMRRANEEATELDEVEAAHARGETRPIGFSLEGMPIAVPSREDGQLALPPQLPTMGSSVGSNASLNTDIFQFSLASTSTVPTAAAASSSAAAHLSSHPIAVPVQLPAATAPRHAPALPPYSSPLTRPSMPSQSPATRAPLAMESEGAGDQSIAMHLAKLPFRLVLLTFHAQVLPQCTFAILHALMGAAAPASSSSASSSSAASLSASTPARFRPSFFSFTQAGSQISLIVEAGCLSLFPSHLVTQHKSVWHALQVSQGTESTDPAGLVAPLSSLLAKVGVSIFYLSTFNNDILLIPEQEIELALQTLTEQMNIMVEE